MKIKTFLFLGSLFTMGCNSPDSWDIFKTTGHTQTITRKLDYFNSVVINENVEFQILLQDTVSKVEISAGKNLLPKIRTSIKNGILQVTNDNKYNFLRSYSRLIRLKIYAKDLIFIQAKTGKNIYIFASPYRDLSTLQIDLPQCSGDLYLQLKARTLRVVANESTCKILGVGNADSLYFTSGYSYGPADFSSFPIKYARVIQNGSNDIRLSVQDSLNVSIYGIGNVIYTGNPNVKSLLVGKGRLIKQ